MRLNGYVYRLYSCLRAHIGTAHAELKLAPLDALTLGAVVRWPDPLTVAQIGRLHNYPRQSIQRSANSLAERGLIEFVPNPRHARAPLLVATPEGAKIEELSERNARSLAATLRHEFPASRTSELADELSALLEAVSTATGHKI